MHKGRRVGTLTAGIVLVVFGLLFVLRHILPFLNYTAIISLWPAILIILGIEVIISYIITKEENMKYDGWAIALVVILSFFAMTMAGAEFTINNLPELKRIF